ncbi:MAG: hypothetical protein ACM31C_19655 [Acidobacteriota bacterium]
MDLRRGVLVAVIALAACSDSPPGRTYYQRNIEPILLQKCAGNTSGCHAANVDDPYQFAAGNLDVTSFANVQKRRDVLAPFGAYPYPLLLIKAVAPATPDPMDPNRLQFQYNNDAAGNPQFLPIDVLHAGGSIIQVNSDAYIALQTWMANGATENGLKPPTPAQSGNGTCSTSVPSGFNAAMYMSNPNFSAFKSTVQPILTAHGCVSSNCHGAPQSDFYITCGDDDTQLAFNFSQAWGFVNNPVDDSQILRVPLAVAAGGRGHTGGDQFSGTDDGDYQTIKTWAQQVGVLDFAMGDPVKQFFADNVQPILIERGCSFMACHSPAATNDFKLRSGTQGFFSAVALEKNYELLKGDFMALEFPDARRGRAVAKTILTDDYRIAGVGGIAHRGGSVLETPSGLPSDPAMCPQPWTTASSPFCTIQEWVTRERAAMAAEVTPMGQGDTVNLVYVTRPAGQAAGRLEFDTFQGGADLKVVQATFGANFGQQLAVTGTAQSLLGNCGLGASPDIGLPDVANDGDSVAFAGRASASVPWSIYRVSIASGTCTQVTPASGMIHNFDPAWSPDGAYIVFASTRGKPGVGPTLSRKRFLPQSDLWRINVADSSVQQMTFLSNSEIRPHFMREGRITMTTEKASDGFYQLSGRRENWDLTDYHPLLAQRASSLYADDTTNPMAIKPSVNYSSATDIREGDDGNFMLIASDVGMDGKPVLPGGAGALATFNRSIGPFEYGRSDPGFFQSMRVLGDPAATGHSGASVGYRSPFYLPDGEILVSYATLPGLAWKVVAVDPRTGAQSDVIANGVDAVVAYKYPARTTYANRRQLVFGGSVDPSDTSHAVIHMPDAPMVFTVLTGNLRRGRPVDAFRTAKQLAVYTEGMCPSSGCTANTNGIYQNRQLLGSAPLADDGSVRVKVPSGTGVVLELQDGNGKPVVTMAEEHQLGPGEQISMGISQKLFDAVCGGCHGSVSGHELDVVVTPDALTGASASSSQFATPVSIGP